MKRTDLAMIVLIAAVSVGVAYFVAHSLLGGMTQAGVKVKTIDPITSVVETPNKAIFNSNAINPSVEVNINQSDTTTTTSGATTDTTGSTR
ncbi:MAG: exported protein of unknown function [Candidatus Saccharibacteria bacterium]|nr:exported protein of unknown function [Candidatus Saccharibacteria bacterium]